ncbi:MAG: hypothetical protein V2A61_07830, partial [Calditrichota bacterium]
RIALYSITVCVLSAWFTLGYWLWYPYDPITVEKPIKIANLNKQVIAGGRLFYEIKYKKNMDVTGTLSRKLINKWEIDLADSVVTAPPGKDGDFVPLTIPSFSEPGKYKFRWSASYKVNPVRTVTVSVESEEFEVILNPNILVKGPKGDIGKQGPEGPKGDKGGITIFGK